MDESDEVMIERQLVGTEITCGCFRRQNGDVVCFPITEVALKGGEFFDYDAKYEGKSDEITPARIAESTAERVRETTRNIYCQLDCYGIIRIDYILSGERGEEQINLLEINTTPRYDPPPHLFPSKFALLSSKLPTCFPKSSKAVSKPVRHATDPRRV